METINPIEQTITVLNDFPNSTAYESWSLYLDDVAVWLAQNKTLSTEIAALVPKLQTLVQELNTFGTGIEQYGTDLTDAIEQIQTAVAQLLEDAQAQASSAAQSAQAANEAKTLAQSYANAEEDVEVEVGEYSARHFSLKSAAIATLAEQHKDGALEAKSAAEGFRDQTETLKDSAAQSAQAANEAKTLAQQAAQEAQAAAAGEVLDDQNVSSLTGFSSSKIENRLQNKQDTLVSGTNIKTLNGEDITGSGNLIIQGDLVKIGTLSSASTAYFLIDGFSTEYKKILIIGEKFALDDLSAYTNTNMYISAYIEDIENTTDTYKTTYIDYSSNSSNTSTIGFWRSKGNELNKLSNNPQGTDFTIEIPIGNYAGISEKMIRSSIYNKYFKNIVNNLHAIENLHLGALTAVKIYAGSGSNIQGVINVYGIK